MPVDKMKKVVLALILVAAVVLAYWVTGGDVPEAIGR